MATVAPPVMARETATLAPDIKKAAKQSKMTPLEYMLAVMNDNEANEIRRDRMAVAAAPFVHGKAEGISEQPEGKKAQRLADAKAATSSGKYAVPPPPKLVVSNK